jgi:thioredoxin-related protein
MKRIFLPSIALLTIGLMISAFSFKGTTPKPEEKAKSTATKPQETVKWLTWQEAVEANKKEPKKFLVDVYTSWCGWCKVMDRETFPNDTIATYLAKNFHCVKLDAEMKESIEFNGHKFEYIAGQGRGGIHTLAYSLLDGEMSYPTIVYLTEKFERVAISPGYKKPQQLLPELKFAAENIYLKKSFKDFMTTGK